jgi:hypothetical protein
MADLRPADDVAIPNEELLLYRVFPSPDVVREADGGGYRPMSGAMKPNNRDEPLSVDLGSLCTPEQTRDRETNGNFHVVQLNVGQVRAAGFRVVRDPILGGAVPNPAHALIYGSRRDIADNIIGGLTNSESEKLARIARFIIITPQPGEPSV